jgi:glutamine amidotransferase
MKPRVTIVDYGLGNLHSVTKALMQVGADVALAETGADIARAERLVLPGVGAFADGMAGLRARDQVEPLREHARRGRALLGICLGAQLLLSESEEFGRHEGLGIIPGRVLRIPAAQVKVPFVGWGRLEAPGGRTWAGTLLAESPAGTWAYFVHSFHAVPENPADICAVTRYGPHPITAAVARGSVTGLQFHPEKSGHTGLAMLRHFIQLEHATSRC